MLELIQAAFGDWRFAAAALTALVAGLVRGFSGFGAAMIFVPIAAALYSPPTAVVLLYVTDGVVTLPLVLRALRHCDWREVAPLALGATLAYPLGLKLLLAIDAVPMRWTISILVLGLVGALATGRRYRRRPGLAGTVTVGGASGLAGGMTGIGGPPIILFWLAGQGLAPQVRANILVYFGLTTVVGGVLYFVNDLFTAPRLVGALGLLPVYAVAIFLGVKAFRFASERVYRRLALALCGTAALVGMPLWS